MEVAKPAKWADLVMMLTPDELQGDIYREHLHDNMKKGAALVFAHGLNVHFNLLDPRADLDVLMIAPKGPGHTVRSEYQRGGGVPCLIAIHKDPSGNAHDLGLSYASAIGGGRAGIIETSFKAKRAKMAEHQIEEVGAKLHDMMPWIKKGALVDKTKN